MIERRDLPLFAWGEALRAARAERRTLQRRITLVALGLGALGLTIATPPRPLLLWNASDSAPIGLYLITSASDLERGDMAIAWPPPDARTLAAQRHYLPDNVPLVKHVAATSGDTVCAWQGRVFVVPGLIIDRKFFDGLGRILPRWSGCITLKHGAVFLLMKDRPDSFDGRYFGPTDRRDIIGKAHLLWAR